MLKITYNALQDTNLKKVLAIVVHVCEDLQIEYLLVGAIARNIWFALGDENPETTQDIDFGVYVSDIDDYNKLKEKLIVEYNFIQSSQNNYCLFTPEGTQVDLLPFSETKKQNQHILDVIGIAAMTFDGFKEAYEVGVKKIIINSETYNVCSIPAIVVLKLIAFDDRPEHRIKDVKDINSICFHYPNIEAEYIWTEYSALYTEKIEHQDIAMIVLGKEMKKLLSLNNKLNYRIIEILDRALMEKSDLIRLMIVDSENETIEMKSKIIRLIKRGIIS